MSEPPDGNVALPCGSIHVERWRREGLVLAPPSDHPWWRSHAQAPTVLPLGDRLWRVYFAVRDDKPRSRIMCADLDPLDGFRVLRIHPKPVLDLGDNGTFDSQGVGPATVLVVGGRYVLYYTGLVQRLDIPHQLAIGLAVSSDGLVFRRAYSGPVLSTGPRDPYFASTPFVRRVPEGYAMAYASCTGWKRLGTALEPVYGLRHTVSSDGVVWNLATVPSIRNSPPDVCAVRPWMVKRGHEDHVWYCLRGLTSYRASGSSPYRIIHDRVAEDGLHRGEACPVEFENPPREGDWDSWMQAYPCVVPLGDDLIMFYNGNEFGAGGFGVARLVGGGAAASAYHGPTRDISEP